MPTFYFVAEAFSKVQKDIYDIIKGRILVGHALHNDLKVRILLYVTIYNCISSRPLFRFAFNKCQQLVKRYLHRI